MKKTSDKPGIKMGMWLFLFTEIMLFSGLFVLYAAYYSKYEQAFIENGKELNTMIGATNTVILLISSFTVAASITAVRRSEKRLCLGFIGASFIAGILFLINKYFEWGHKIEHGIFPGSSELAKGDPGKNIFFSLYYLITGLHGIHILIGLTLLAFSFAWVKSGRVNADKDAFLENSGLYWHLVDLIWIFIFPLFYLLL